MGEKKYNIFSILAIIFTFLVFPLGIVFGIVALVQIKKTGEAGKGLAVASIIITGGFLVLLVGLGILWVVVRSWINSSPDVNRDLCTNTDIFISDVNCWNGAVNQICNLTIMKIMFVDESPLAGVRLVFRNPANGVFSPIIDVPGDLPSTSTVDKTGIDTKFPNSDKITAVEITGYYRNESGTEVLCSTRTKKVI